VAVPIRREADLLCPACSEFARRRFVMCGVPQPMHRHEVRGAGAFCHPCHPAGEAVGLMGWPLPRVNTRSPLSRPSANHSPRPAWSCGRAADRGRWRATRSIASPALFTISA
jgi:hypothetical protein